MAQVAQDVSAGMPLEECAREPDKKLETLENVEKDEEAAVAEEAPAEETVPEEKEKKDHCLRNFTIFFFGLIVVFLVIALAVGLTANNDGSETTNAASTTTKTTVNPNLKYFDAAAALIEKSPLGSQVLPSGEIMSYREYNPGNEHVLVFLPGFMNDDTIASLLAVMPEFEDHHIIAVNPIGWHGTTMKKSIYSHEENADEVMTLLDALGVEKAMAMGYSTGGGIAFYLAQKYPDIISAAFLMHSIPLHGLKMEVPEDFEVGDPYLFDIEEAKDIVPELMEQTYPDLEADADLFEFISSFSTNPEGYLPMDHKLGNYFAEGALEMPGKVEAGIANTFFNVTPIRTPVSPPSSDLASLKSKVIVIHGAKDFLVPVTVVEPVTKLAIAEEWAPKGTLSYYDDGVGHLAIIDSPEALAKTYRKALEEQVLAVLTKEDPEKEQPEEEQSEDQVLESQEASGGDFDEEATREEAEGAAGKEATAEDGTDGTVDEDLEGATPVEEAGSGTRGIDAGGIARGIHGSSVTRGIDAGGSPNARGINGGDVRGISGGDNRGISGGDARGGCQTRGIDGSGGKSRGIDSNGGQSRGISGGDVAAEAQEGIDCGDRPQEGIDSGDRSQEGITQGGARGINGGDATQEGIDGGAVRGITQGGFTRGIDGRGGN